MSGPTGSVAVLTPTLPHRNSLLDQARASVAAQTFPCTHLVGVDESREGPAAIRNRLAAASDADWLLPLDDDDLLDPDCVERLIAASDGADVVVPWCRVEDHDPKLAPWTPNRLFRPEVLLHGNFVPVTSLVRADLWLEVGGMPDREFEDWHFWRRLAAEGARFRVVPEVLFTYRREVAGAGRHGWSAAGTAA